MTTAKPTERDDVIKLLEQLLAPCGTPHVWQNCKRCMAVHGIEMRFALTMRLLDRAVRMLREVKHDR